MDCFFNCVKFNVIIIKLTKSVEFISAPPDRANFIPDKSPFLAYSIRLSSYSKKQ